MGFLDVGEARSLTVAPGKALMNANGLPEAFKAEMYSGGIWKIPRIMRAHYTEHDCHGRISVRSMSDYEAALDHDERREKSTMAPAHQRWRWAVPISVAALAFWALCAAAQESQSQRAADAVAQPATRGPMQAEMDKADVDPDQWLTSNKGYLAGDVTLTST